MPRKSKLQDNQLNELIEMMKSKYFTGWELLEILKKRYAWKGTVEMFLTTLEAKKIPVFEEPIKPGKTWCRYKVLTAEEINKYEEEKTKDAKRRLLAAISC